MNRKQRLINEIAFRVADVLLKENPLYRTKGNMSNLRNVDMNDPYTGIDRPGRGATNNLAMARTGDFVAIEFTNGDPEDAFQHAGDLAEDVSKSVAQSVGSWFHDLTLRETEAIFNAGPGKRLSAFAPDDDEDGTSYFERYGVTAKYGDMNGFITRTIGRGIIWGLFKNVSEYVLVIHIDREIFQTITDNADVALQSGGWFLIKSNEIQS